VCPNPKAQAGGGESIIGQGARDGAAPARTLDPLPPFSPAVFFGGDAKLLGSCRCANIREQQRGLDGAAGRAGAVESIRAFLQKHDVPLEPAQAIRNLRKIP